MNPWKLVSLLQLGMPHSQELGGTELEACSSHDAPKSCLGESWMLLQTRSQTAQQVNVSLGPANTNTNAMDLVDMKERINKSMSLKPNSCTPQCSWQCESVKCDQVCRAVCKAPHCETRCKAFNTSGCHMDCAEPNCAVICPKRDCPGGSCPQCYTACSKAVCKMRCDDSNQPCRNVCLKPECKWECHAREDCPRPSCSMICESPKDCPELVDSEHLPPLEHGERATTTVAPTEEVNETTSTVAPSTSTGINQTTPTAPPDVEEEPDQLLPEE